MGPIVDDHGRAVPDSYWAATAEPLQAVRSFEGRLDTDVAVVGGGFTGLSAALHLAQAGVPTVALDACEPGWGASGRNMGHVVAALKHEPHEIEARFGAAVGSKLIDAIGLGPDVVFDLITRHSIRCSPQRAGIITAAHSWKSLRDLERRADAWNRRGVAVRMLSSDEVVGWSGTSYYRGASFDPRGGAINPLGYARGLANAAAGLGARVFQDACVQGISRQGDGWSLDLGNGTVRARKVIFATNGYTGHVWPGLHKTILPARTPQLVSEPIDLRHRRTILPGGQAMSDTRLLTLGVRVHPDGRLHLGGGGGTAGGSSTRPFETLKRHARELFPSVHGLRWSYQWTGFMAMTPDRYPRLHELAPGVAACLGYSGRGVAMATLMGRELSTWAQEKAGIDELILPGSPLSGLPLHALSRLWVGLGIRYYGLSDRLARRQPPGRR